MSSEQGSNDPLSSYKLLPNGELQYISPEEELEKRKREIVEGVQYLEENIRPLLEKINSTVLEGRGEIFTTDLENLSARYQDSTPWIKLQWKNERQADLSAARPESAPREVDVHIIQILYTNDPWVWGWQTYKHYDPYLGHESKKRGVTLVRESGDNLNIITEGEARIDGSSLRRRPITKEDWEPELLSLILAHMKVITATHRYRDKGYGTRGGLDPVNGWPGQF